jgi:hypothetical protein
MKDGAPRADLKKPWAAVTKAASLKGLRLYLAALPARRSTSEGSATCKSNEATCESWAAARTFAHRADELTRGTELSMPAKGKSPAAPGLGRVEHESLPTRSSSGPHRPDAP